MKLAADDFLAVVKNSPLVSIDLVIKDGHKSILLGQRKNRPAQGFWFIPGGRIQKGEHVADAFCRTTLEELGISYDIQQARFLGVFEHIYDDNFMGVAGIGTHYVVLACELTLSDPEKLNLHLDQHSQWKWWEVSSLLASSDVHVYTKAYFQSPASTLAFKGEGFNPSENE